MNIIPRLRAWFQTRSWLAEQSQAWARQHFPPGQQVIASKVAAILVGMNCVEFTNLSPASRFIEDLHMDDLEPVSLLDDIHEEFGLDIPDEDCEKFRTVSDVVNYLSTHTAA